MRLADGGPIYCETNLAATIAEPFNTFSEVAFLLVVLVWARRLRGRAREHLFVACVLPVIFVAFVGGVLFHGFRSHRVFFLMDVVPLIALLLAAVTYLCYRVTRRAWLALVYVVAFFFLSRLIFLVVPGHVAAIALSYAFAAVAMALPVLVEVRLNEGRGLRFVVRALVAVAVGTVLHVIDLHVCHVVPMGTHWLWHVLAAVAVHYLIRYLVEATPASTAPASRV